MEQDKVLQKLIDDAKTAGRDYVPLDDVASCAYDNGLDQGAVESLIRSLEAAGLSVDEPVSEADIKKTLGDVLSAARVLTDELKRRPSPEEIAVRVGIPVEMVRNVLHLGASLSAGS